MQRDFLIPDCNIPSFKKRIEKLSRRADKNKIQMPKVVFGITVNERVKDKSGVVGIVQYQKVSIIADDVNEGGWQIVATLQHITEGNIVRNISGQDLPKNYRNAPPDCDHCNINRKRSDTYVLRHQDGTYRQVGATCMEDFIKGSATHIIRQAHLISNVLDATESAETLPTLHVDNISLWPLEVYLAYCVDVVAKNGWVSKSEAYHMGSRSTAEMAFLAMTDSSEHRASPSDAAMDEAGNTTEWAEGLDEENIDEYHHNLKTIAMSCTVQHRTLGFAASMVMAYRKAMQGRSGSVNKTESNHVGNVGDKINIKLNVTSATSSETQYGESWFYRMKDEGGNIFIWRTGSVLESGKDFIITGKIKEHSEWRGQKQTVLTRCRFAEVES